ncbi:MAG: amidohydrolase family protein [Pirellulaceae bacterium]|nr:amidohydrolase family protein [Pirellulaceae bacterium]
MQPSAHESRRRFLAEAGAATAIASLQPCVRAADEKAAATPLIDTHMHVWAADARKYPFLHPYQADFRLPPHEATVEMLLEDMNREGCTHAVLVQVIYHGWDNAYVADCARLHPRRFKAHGLIDPTDPQVADKLEFWIKERGLAGMRFSPRYYFDGQHGGDAWLDADHTHRLWRVAQRLGAVFNFFVAPPQLPRLAKMAAAHPEVPVIVDHLGQLDLAAANPEPEIRMVLNLAKQPNIHVKVSELASVSESKRHPFSDAFPFVKRVYEAFGPDRLLFGTGYPGAARAAYQRPTLRQEVDLIAKDLPFLSAEERAKILGGNAAKLWGFGN